MTELRWPQVHADCVRRTLLCRLPSGDTGSVYVSRAATRGLKPHSDADLLIDNPGALPLAAVAELREAFAESKQPGWFST